METEPSAGELLMPASSGRDASIEDVVILGGSAHVELAASIARELGLALGTCRVEPCPDGELEVTVGKDVRGLHAVLVQPTARPAGDHLLELLLMADACRRVGARAVTAIIPYMGYARQDRRTRPDEALGMRVVAELLACGRFHRIVAVDLHNAAIEGFLDVPLDHVTALPLLADAVRPRLDEACVVVSPDLGAVKLARELARLLALPTAIVHKTRLSPSEVRTERITGPVRGMRPIIVDDMITTGGTIQSAADALLSEGCTPEIIVVATHAVLVGPAVQRLHAAGISLLVASDTLPSPKCPPFVCETVSVAPVLAEAVRRASVSR